MYFLFYLFLKTSCHKFCKAKNIETKCNFHLIYSRKSKEGLGWMRELTQRQSFLVCSPVCNFEGLNGMLLPLSFMSPLLLHNHVNAENEEALFQGLRIFCMMTSIFTFSHIGKSHFHEVPPNSECIRA